MITRASRPTARNAASAAAVPSFPFPSRHLRALTQQTALRGLRRLAALPEHMRADDDQIAAGWREIFAAHGLALAAVLVTVALDERMTEFARPVEHPTPELLGVGPCILQAHRALAALFNECGGQKTERAAVGDFREKTPPRQGISARISRYGGQRRTSRRLTKGQVP